MSSTCLKCKKEIKGVGKTGMCNSCARTGVPRSEETRKKISDYQKNKIVSEETCKKLKSVPRTEDWCKKISEANKGKKRSEEARRKMSEAKKGKSISETTRNKRIGRKLTNDHRKHISDAHIGLPRSKEHCEKISINTKVRWEKPEFKSKMKRIMQNLWSTTEHQEKMKKAFSVKPTKPELKLEHILNTLFPNEYKYVGDFKFWIDGRNPDFININGKKKLIELFGDYWHKKDDSQDRINHFKEYGFETLIVWESELKDFNKLEEKLIQFHKGGGAL